MAMKKRSALSTPAVAEPNEAENIAFSSLDMTKDRASRFQGLTFSCELFESGLARLAVRGEDSDPAFGSSESMRLGQDQTDREVLHGHFLGCSKFCLAGDTCTSQRTSTRTGRATRSRGSPPAGARCTQAGTRWSRGAHVNRSWRCRARPYSAAWSKEQPRPRSSSP